MLPGSSRCIATHAGACEDETALDRLEQAYDIDDAASVASFIQAHGQVARTLEEARSELARRFGSSAVPSVETVTDPDSGALSLLVTVRTSGGVADAIVHLRAFRTSWWATRGYEQRRLIAWTIG
jgi:hypothetical protein